MFGNHNLGFFGRIGKAVDRVRLLAVADICRELARIYNLSLDVLLKRFS